jgi:hypothetical protein
LGGADGRAARGDAGLEEASAAVPNRARGSLAIGTGARSGAAAEEPGAEDEGSSLADDPPAEEPPPASDRAQRS